MSRESWLTPVALASIVLAVVTAACATTTQRPENGRLSRPEADALTRIGEDAVRAVLARNIKELIGYARPDLRQNRRSIDAMRSELEKYLLGDVYRVVVSARPLRIHVRNLGPDDAGTRWAQLVFYDAGKITDRTLRDPEFLCKHDLTDAVAWTFRRVDGNWEALGYPFDAFTDIHCPPG